MADGSFPTLISKDRDVNAVANPIYVNLSDGTDVIAIDSSGYLTVNVNGTVTVSSTNLDIRDLAATQDNVRIWANTAKDGTGTNYIPIVDADGQLQVDVLSLPAISVANVYTDDTAYTPATDKVGAIGAMADETSPDSVDEGDIGIPRMTLDRKLLARVVGASDANRLDIDASGHAQIDLAAVSVTAVPVSATTAANSSGNPIYVSVVSAGVSTTEVQDYGTGTASSDASVNNDYTVTATTFLLRSVIFAASGGMKAEIQVGPVASLVTKAVGFIPRQGGTEQLFFDPPIEVPVASTGTVRVVMTNRQGASMDVYSTIIGDDV